MADKVVSVLRRRGTHKPIKHLETKSINVYVSDDNITSEEVKVKIVAKYIGNNHGLWNDYAKGLLQVVDIEKTIVTPPRIPWDDQ